MHTAGIWKPGGGGGSGAGGTTAQEAPSSILDPVTGLLKTEKYRTINTNTTFQIAPYATDKESAESVCKNNGGSLAAYVSQQEQVRLASRQPTERHRCTMQHCTWRCPARSVCL